MLGSARVQTLLASTCLALVPAGSRAALAAPTPAAAPEPVAPIPTAAPRSVAGPTVDEAEPNTVLEDALRPQAGGLTADQVAAKAFAAAPSVEGKVAELEIAAAQVDQVMASFFPTLTASASYTRLSDVRVNFGSGALVGAANAGPLGVGPCPDGTGQCVVDGMGVPVVGTEFLIPQVLSQFSLNASLSIPISDYVFRSIQGLKAAKASQKAAELAQQIEARKVRIDARVAYYNWVRATAQVAVAKDSVTTVQARLADAQTGFRIGVLTKADELRIRALVANAERMVSQAETFRAVAERNLAVIMADEPRSYMIGEDVIGQLQLTDWPDLDVLVDEAQAGRLEFAMFGHNVTALRRGIRTERSGYYPRLDAFGDAIYARPNPRFFPPTEEFNGTWQAGVRLSYNVGNAIATRQRIKELNGRGRNLSAQEEMMRRGIEMEVTSAWSERTNALASIQLARIAKEATEAAYRATVAQFRVGRATATDLITAQGELVSSQLQYVNAHIDLRVAEAKLTYALGRGEG